MFVPKHPNGYDVCRPQVAVGNINVVVGYLRYEETLTASTAFR